MVDAEKTTPSTDGRWQFGSGARAAAHRSSPPNSRPNRNGSLLPRRSLLSAGAVAGVGVMTGGLAACDSDAGDAGESKLDKKINNPPDNLNRKGFPIVDESITLHFMTGKRPLSAKDYNKVASWKKYQNMSNVKIDWGLVPNESIEEKRNLALGSDDYPDAFHSCGFGVSDLAKYGEQGVFVRLNNLIEHYMPNLQEVLQKYPSAKKGMTFPDGDIYGMPLIYDPNFLGLRISNKLWVRNDWLDKLDMDVPSTTEEYYKYLKAVKRKRPGGESHPVPYCEANKLGKLRPMLAGSFGIRNRCTDYIDVEPGDDGTVRFYPISDGYSAMLEYLHKLYDQGLIAKNIFSIDESKFRNGMSAGTYGSTVFIAPYFQFGKEAKHYTSTPALKGPEGDHKVSYVHSALAGAGNFVITDKNKHPVETARWMDYFYSTAGGTLFFMGVEGKSYKNTKNGPQYLDKIIHNPKLPMDQALKPYSTYFGGGYPGIIKEQYFKGAESTKESIKAAKLLEPDAHEEAWPGFTYTAEEQEHLDSLADDIEKYADESTDRFIAGDMAFSNWNKYVKKIKGMGLDEYLKIHQDAYKRYKKV